MAETDIQLTVNLTPGDVQKSAERLQRSIQKVFDGIDVKNFDASLAKSLTKLNKINDTLIETSKELEALKTTKDRTGTFLGMESELRGYREKYASLNRNKSLGKFTKEDQDVLDEVNNKIDEITRKMNALRKEGGLLLNANGTVNVEAFGKLDPQIDNLVTKLGNYNNEARIATMTTLELQDKLNGLEQDENEAGNSAEEMAQKFEEFREALAGGILNAARAIGGALARVATTLWNISSSIVSGGISKLQSIFNNAKRSVDNFSKSSKRMLWMIIRASLGVRGLFMLFRKVVSAVKEGIGNFNKYQAANNQTNKAVEELTGSLSTLKNSLGAAFAPIINAVAPALNYLISLLIKAANAFSAFMAAIFGGGTFIKATKQVGNLNKGLGGTAKAADKAKRALAGFDDLDVLNPENDDDSGGGGGGGGVDYGSLFETATIPDQISEFAEKVKEAWEKADFTEIGNIVGLKLKEGLEKASEYITTTARDFARKLASSIATFVNGFVKTDGLGEQIGTTLADAINTAITFALTLLQTMDFKAIGRFIGDAINGFFENINWEELAQTIYLKFIGIFQMIGAAVSQINWYDIGTRIANGFASVDWGTAVSTFFEGIGKALGGIGAFIWGVFKVAWDAMWEENFAPYLDENGQMTIKGWLQGMDKLLTNIGKWIYDHVFQPFIHGFKMLFQIESPSRVMAELGTFVMQGFLNAVSSFVEPIISVFTDVKNKIINVFTQMWNSVKGVINGMIGGVERMANSVVTGLNTVIDALNNMGFGPVPDWVPFIGGKEFKLNIPKMSSISIPRLAQGAVIPPNSQFLAMLGDQRHGTNIEAPLDMIKEAFADVVGNMQVQNTGYSEMVLDGQTFARLIVPYVISELNRQGYDVTVLEG